MQDNLSANLGAMDLDDVRIFTKVAELGSFTRAAQILDLPKSTVSRRVAELEEKLDTRLLQRTTRKLTLTHAGQLYFARTSRAIVDLEQAERALQEMQSEPRGVLRITTPSDMSGLLVQLIKEFQVRYPLVEIVVLSTGRRVDLVAEGYDLALRAAERLSDSSLLSKKLLDSRLGLFASPEYVKKHGSPQTVAELSGHDCLIFGTEGLKSTWTLSGPTGTEEVAVRGKIASNDFSFLLGACVSGMGVGFLPIFRPSRLVESGHLIELLPGYRNLHGALYAVYPSARHLSANVRAFIDFATTWLGECESMCKAACKENPMPAAEFIAG